MPDSRHTRLPDKATPQESIVLVQNEVTIDPQYESWRDETGKQYHFPNAYINLITEGKPFVYYRGTRREGAQRKIPEYFGCGIIGMIAADPETRADELKRNRKWFATIRDYVPFDQAVPFQLNGKYLEHRQGREWGRPRLLPQETYHLILDIAGIQPLARVTTPGLQLLPQIDDVHIALVPPGTTIVRARKKASGTGSQPGVGSADRFSTRYSNKSQIVGRRAEEIAMKYFRSILSPAEQATLVWVASEGGKPGWDIQYRNIRDTLVAVEVKGSVGHIFDSVEVTANEWLAAESLRENYVLMLVANCLGANPVIELFHDPISLLARKSILLTPTVYRIEFAPAASSVGASE